MTSSNPTAEKSDTLLSTAGWLNLHGLGIVVGKYHWLIDSLKTQSIPKRDITTGMGPLPGATTIPLHAVVVEAKEATVERSRWLCSSHMTPKPSFDTALVDVRVPVAELEQLCDPQALVEHDQLAWAAAVALTVPSLRTALSSDCP